MPGVSDPVVAVDIGGTKLEVGVVEPDGVIRWRTRAPTETADADALWRTLAGMVEEAIAAADGEASAVGVGCGGPMARGGVRVSPLNIGCWRDFPLHGRLAALTGLPVKVDNDAKALARAEGRWGAAVGVEDYVAMVVSTGVGGGIVSGGVLLEGAAGNAGHIGHVIVEPDGRRCGCGAQGCLEAEASGSAIAAMTGAPAAEASRPVRERTGRLVGCVVASVANLLDLRLAVVAGSVALGYGDVFFGAAQAELDRRARLDHARGARIVPAGCGADGPLLGAAAVGWEALGPLATAR